MEKSLVINIFFLFSLIHQLIIIHLGTVYASKYEVKWFDKVPKNLENLDGLVELHSTHGKFQCVMPHKQASDSKGSYGYYGLPPMSLLKEWFKQEKCNYRVERYWTYQICHGRHVRQFHEERQSERRQVTSEFYLGRQVNLDFVPRKGKPPTKWLEGSDYPYYEVEMVDGAKCDLTGQPRKTRVHYICHQNSRGEIYSFREASSCVYEITSLISALCKHPDFAPLPKPVFPISCYTDNELPPMLLEMRIERLMLQARSSIEKSSKLLHQTLFVRLSSQDAVKIKNALPQESESASSLHPEGLTASPQTAGSSTSTFQSVSPSTSAVPPVGPSADNQVVSEILGGQFCISGGSGWWRHEFCFGRHVLQFHEDMRVRTQVIRLGQWSAVTQREWISDRPLKAPTSKLVVLYYGRGDFCEETKSERFVEVRLRCPDESKSSSKHEVAMYLTEPRMCEYSLTLDSFLFCDIIPLADEYGLFPVRVPPGYKFSQRYHPPIQRKDSVPPIKSSNSDQKSIESSDEEN